MEYKNNLKGYIEPEETNDDKGLPSKTFDSQRRYYHLSHRKNDSRTKLQRFIGLNGELKSDPQEMSLEEIRNYVNKYYIHASYVNIYELINDLNIFKSYKEEIKIENEIKQICRDTIASILTIMAIFSAVAVGFLSVDKGVLAKFRKHVYNFYGTNFKFIFRMMWILTACIVAYLIFLYWNVNKKSGFNRLKTLNYTILTLESIRDDIYNNKEESKAPEAEKFELRIRDISDSNYDRNKETYKIPVEVREVIESNKK